MSDFASRLKAAIEHAGLSVSELAAASKVPEPTIFALQAARTKNPRLETVAQLVKALKCDAIWLMTGEAGGAVDAYESTDELSDGYVVIPSYRIKLGAGAEAEPEWEEEHEAEPAAFPRSFFYALGVNPKNCKQLMVRGDSMEPTLSNGDSVIIDCSDRYEIVDGRVYAFWDGALRIKRLRRMRSCIVIHSDNPDYKDEELSGPDLEQFRLIGRAVYHGGAVF